MMLTTSLAATCVLALTTSTATVDAASLAHGNTATAGAQPWAWTKKQAEYRVSGNGNPYIIAVCNGVGAPYRRGGINYYYRLACVTQFHDGSQYYETIKPVSGTRYRMLTIKKLRGATGGSGGGSGSVYVATGDGHWITDKSLDGSVVTLEDGSRWLVSPIDRYNDATWLVVDNVTVIDGSDPSYPYQLIDTDDTSTVDARFLGY
jgi:hypothetical protein